MTWPRNALLLLLVLSLALPACGFRLRGAVDLPPAMEHAAAEGVAQYSALGEALARSWQQSGGRLDFDADAESARTRLTITRDDLSRRTLSVDSAGRPNEYQLTYKVAFELFDADGEPLMESQSVSVNRAYQFNPDNSLAMADEEERLEQILAEEAAVQMLRRITFQLRQSAKTPSPSTPAERDDETAR
ncbi:LPS-assembly lipoprotein LptE [Thiohalophilus thiocyanatoxydans]|uniref:LPS-assembly lipoprotein LptE n=1 Tax=Thiohalophilus thiocyanatoxydans TaxID=381308 RepID=A0A4R8IK09_9GAMM|nr:LPS assembly lipoprotein LptE [Thiohalophilus thiocyanatoxydans]TDY01066.1 LPS-assembly lipoprotein [Thiohalophilus thiocyanatoxydans]